MLSVRAHQRGCLILGDRLLILIFILLTQDLEVGGVELLVLSRLLWVVLNFDHYGSSFFFLQRLMQ
jgi:hypothetical protein